MKKTLIALLASTCMAFALAGCASGGTSASSAASSAGEAISAAATSADATSAAETSAQTGMANPWSDVASAEEAAAGAGLDGFTVPVGSEISLGAIDASHTTYRCMDGIAEADVEFPAVSMTIRKGRLDAAVEDGDISGDYRDCSLTWAQNVGGVEVTSKGNRDDASMRTTWTNGDVCYSVTVEGLGGDTDYGLSAADLDVIVAGLK